MNVLNILKGWSDVGIFPNSQLSVVKVEGIGSAYLEIKIITGVGHCQRIINMIS